MSANLIQGRYVYTISSDGVREESADSESMLRWSGVQKVHDASDHIFVVGRGVGAILPKRCLTGPEVVLETLQEHLRSARNARS